MNEQQIFNIEFLSQACLKIADMCLESSKNGITDEAILDGLRTISFSLMVDVIEKKNKTKFDQDDIGKIQKDFYNFMDKQEKILLKK